MANSFLWTKINVFVLVEQAGWGNNGMRCVNKRVLPDPVGKEIANLLGFVGEFKFSNMVSMHFS